MLRMMMLRNKINSVQESGDDCKANTVKNKLNTKTNEAITMRSQISIDEMARRLMDNAMFYKGSMEDLDSVYEGVRASKLWFECVKKDEARKAKEIEMKQILTPNLKNKNKCKGSNASNRVPTNLKKEVPGNDPKKVDKVEDYYRELANFKKEEREDPVLNSKIVDMGSGDTENIIASDRFSYPMDYTELMAGDGNQPTVAKSESNDVEAERGTYDAIENKFEVQEDIFFEASYDQCVDANDVLKKETTSVPTVNLPDATKSVSIEEQRDEMTNSISRKDSHFSIQKKKNKKTEQSDEIVFSGWDPVYAQSEYSNSEISRGISHMRFDNTHNKIINSRSNNLIKQIQSDLYLDSSVSSDSVKTAGYILHKQTKEKTETNSATVANNEKNLFETQTFHSKEDGILCPDAETESGSIYTEDRSVAHATSECSGIHDDQTKSTYSCCRQDSDKDGEDGLKSCSKCDLLQFNSDSARVHSDESTSNTRCVSRCSETSSSITGSRTAARRSRSQRGKVHDEQSDGWRTSSEDMDDRFRIPACPVASRECNIGSQSEDESKNEYIFLNTYSKEAGGGDEDPNGYYTRILGRYANPIVPPPFPFPSAENSQKVNRSPFYNQIRGISPRKNTTKPRQTIPREPNSMQSSRERNKRISSHLQTNKTNKHPIKPENKSSTYYLQKSKGSGVNKSESNEGRDVLKLPIIECAFKVARPFYR